MRSRRYVAALLTAVTVVGVGVGATAAISATATAQDGGGGDLVARLAEVDRQIGDLPPGDVLVDPELTWADFVGDFVSAQLRFDGVEGELRELWVAAVGAEGPEAEAVATASKALLQMRRAYAYLAAWETHEIEFPLDTFDERGVATGADEARGPAETGFRLLSGALTDALPAYRFLRDSPAAGDSRGALEARVGELEVIRGITLPLVHEGASLQDTQTMLPLRRFVTDAPGVEARARTFTVACIDRDLYDASPFAALTPEILAAGGPAVLEALASIGQVILLDDVTTIDCPDLDVEIAEERLDEQTLQDLLGVDPAAETPADEPTAEATEAGTSG